MGIIRIRFRNRLPDPCPHSRSIAPLPFPHRDANGYGKIELDPIWTDKRKRQLTAMENVIFT